MKRVAIYVRVSTAGQTTDTQRCELEAVAKGRGWQVIATYEDSGVSGGMGRDQRPGLNRMLKDAVAGRVDLVAAWSIDRLGRSLRDLIHYLSDLRAVGCDLYLHQQSIDTTTPSGMAMFHMLGVFAEFERGMIRERVKAGLARAKASGVNSDVVALHRRPKSASGSSAGAAWGSSKSVVSWAWAPASCSGLLEENANAAFSSTNE